MRSRRVRFGDLQEPLVAVCDVYEVTVTPDVWGGLLDCIQDSMIPELPEGFIRVDRQTGDIIILIAGFKED